MEFWQGNMEVLLSLNYLIQKNVLEAIDCNKQGFIKRLIELQKQGFCYDIIINKKESLKKSISLE